MVKKQSILTAVLGILLLLLTGIVCFGEEPGSTVFTFVLPASYASVDETLMKQIPASRPALIYLISEANLDGFDKGGPFRPELTLRGVTEPGGTTLRFAIPAQMVGQKYAVLAIVILDPAAYQDFDLAGKTTAFMVDAPDRVITGIAKETEGFFTSAMTPDGRVFSFDLDDAYDD